MDRSERAQVATLDLRAGRKAKASAAYDSACVYFAAGTALLDEGDWRTQYDLMFNLQLERAECEFLSSNFDTSERLIAELLQRAASKIDQAAAYLQKVLLHTVKSENQQAVDSALTCLRLFSIDISAHPPQEQVQAEYERVWRNLDGRLIENLIDLPQMTDPELQTATDMLSALLPPALFTDFNLCCLVIFRIVNLSMKYGTNGATANAYGYCGTILGPVFHRYSEGFCFNKLACDLVDKHGFIAYRPKIYFLMGTGAFWTQPIARAIEFHRAAFRAATETGDPTYACYSQCQSIHALLLRNDPLDAVWRESEQSLDFARNARFRDMADAIISQQRLVATMQGRTATLSTFSDAQFDEAMFEAQLTEDRIPTMVVLYWILKLRARFLSGDYGEAFVAADKAKALLWSSAQIIYVLDYFYYAALTVAALYDGASAEEQTGWRDLLNAHREQLREWADNYPPTFGDKHALVLAEIARIEGQDLDAMRLYEEAIRAARENGFVQNEGLANELAGLFYLKRGIEKVAHSYLRDARCCYLRWGALGKAQQLDERYPGLPEHTSARPIATIGVPVEHLDMETLMKASQAISGEIVLQKLIKALMTIAVEHAGAERGLLILSYGEEYQIEAEARTGGGGVEVELRQASVTPSDLPDALLHYVIRTQERVILDDASTQNLFSQDEYVRQQRPRSVLCLPLVKQVKLVGALYLENNLVPRVFTPKRLAMLEMLAAQAAISLDHARLYADLNRLNAELSRSEAYLAEGEKISHTASWAWNVATGETYWSQEHFRIFDFDPEKAMPSYPLFLQRIHPEDRRRAEQTIERAVHERSDFVQQYRLVLPDGSIKYVHTVGHPIVTESGVLEFIGTAMDVTERVRAEETARETHAQLARVTRLTTLGELAASIAHEVNQPLGAIANNVNACFRLLSTGSEKLREVEAALSDIAKGVDRVHGIVLRMRALAKKVPPEMTRLHLEDVVTDVLTLLSHELSKRQVAIYTELSRDLPSVFGDRVQLQQVVLNLVMNGVEAMDQVADRERKISIRARHHEHNGSPAVLFSVQDSGIGLKAAEANRIFEAFYTTKANGMGMGLAISRSIVEAHGGLLRFAQSGSGTTFEFLLPTKS